MTGMITAPLANKVINGGGANVIDDGIGGIFHRQAQFDHQRFNKGFIHRYIGRNAVKDLAEGDHLTQAGDFEAEFMLHA